MRVHVALTCFKRPQLLERQIRALRENTLPPAKITVWVNASGHQAPEDAIRMADQFVYCSWNMGVWARMLPLVEEPMDYVAGFDDDTIPGRAFLRTCVDILEDREECGVVGTVGITFPEGCRIPRHYSGWGHKTPYVHRVDLTGQGWVARPCVIKQWIKLYRSTGPTCGEDYAMALAAQLCGMQSWCSPHPEHNTDLWGSTEGQLGADNVALYLQDGAEQDKHAAHERYRQLGWRTMADE